MTTRPLRARSPTQRVDIDDYARRGRDCIYGNLKFLVRATGAIYDGALRPLGIRAAQLDLMWAIIGAQPVSMARLAELTWADQTTLSRTVDRLVRAGLVSAVPGEDRRTRILALTPAGRRLFRRAMPLWEAAQKSVGEWMPAGELKQVARSLRKRSAT